MSVRYPIDRGGTGVKLTHVAIYVEDLERSAEFFEKYFNGKRGESHFNSATGISSLFISFSDNCGIELTSLPQRIRHSTILTYGYMHIAFSVGSRTDVDKLTLRLTHDGYGLNTYPRINSAGNYEGSIFDPDGNLIEIME